jgi:hypothetical protein
VAGEVAYAAGAVDSGLVLIDLRGLAICRRLREGKIFRNGLLLARSLALLSIGRVIVHVSLTSHYKMRHHGHWKITRR